jgi:SAM-dependent methyltransferase
MNSGGDQDTKAIRTYEQFARFYDAYTHGFKADFEFYARICAGKEKILEVGCGTGRILRFLGRLGYDLVGVDISEEMLKIARSKLKNYFDRSRISLINHDFLLGPLNGDFDALLITWYTFNYVLEKEDLFLDRVKTSMKPKAIMVMDLFCPSPLKDRTVNGRTIKKTIVFDSREIDLYDTRQFSGDLEIRVQEFSDGRTPTRIETRRRYYSPSTIQALLSGLGFVDIRFYKDYNLDRGITDLKEIERQDFQCLAANPG